MATFRPVVQATETIAGQALVGGGRVLVWLLRSNGMAGRVCVCVAVSLSEAAPRDNQLGKNRHVQCPAGVVLAQHGCTCDEDWRPLDSVIRYTGTTVHR